MHLSHHRPNRRLTACTTERARRQRGYLMVMFALLLVPMLLMAGFAVDIGSWYSRASDIRRAADAAALAGVVWLPDEAKARAVALEAAAKNGFVPGGNILIDVQTSAISTRRLKVTITDTRVGSFFYEAVGGKKIELKRTSWAEYVLPVPLGSPRNFFGTGTLLASNPVSGFTPEYLYEAVNPYCTLKENGDRYQSGYSGGICSGTANSEYRSTGYQMYIDVPAGRSSAIDVRLYDARYNIAQNMGTPNGTIQGYEACYRDLGGDQTVTGPLNYWGSAGWTVLAPGVTASARYVRDPIQGTTDNAIDAKVACGAGEEDYTYTLFQADNTPLNDNDNPQVCQKAFAVDTPFDGYTYLGSGRWNTLCSIPRTWPSGRYIVRVTNSGAITNPAANGSNNWGLVAKYPWWSSTGLCDGRTNTMCPRVYGVDAISVMAAAKTSVASFFLAEIAPEHAGKQLKLELFDPGEGGQSIEIMRPTGTNGNTWTPASFSWKADGATPASGSGTSLDVTAQRFNGKLVEVNVDLNGYNPPSNNRWWQIRYTFSGDVTDRTTWSARVTGDPVHLVEEY